MKSHVVIAGAGPVGLITALGLARSGIRVTVLEAESAINDSPRAMVYFPVTLELLEKLDIVDDAHAVGVRNDQLQFKFRGSDLTIRLTPAVIKDDTKYPYQLHFGQNVLAGIVQKHLLRLPDTDVQFNSRVSDVTQDGNGVTVSVETQSGTRHLHCDWLIGCDGGRSGVRKALDLSFDGITWPERFTATNIRYDEFPEHGFGKGTFYCHPERWAVIAVIGREQLWRVTYNEDGELSDEEALRRIPERLREILPGSGRYELVAASPYRVHERISSRLRVGRVLLAGDAAHVCNPCGGMGLTTGLMDANALIDALGSVIDGEADESLLDFYERERRRVFLEVSSPAATEYKRLLGEKDAERRRQDVANLQRVAGDPDIMRHTMLRLFETRGKPMLQ